MALIGGALPGAGSARAADAHAPLWAVHGAHNTVYFLGSVHVLKAQERALPDAVAVAYRRASVLVMELDVRQAKVDALAAPVAALAMLPEGTTLAAELGPDAYARFVEGATRAGLAPTALERYRPWFVAMLLTQAGYSRQGYEFSEGVESQLARRAEADHKRVLGLETLEQQLSVFATLSGDDQRRLLLYALDDANEAPEVMDEIVAAWRRGDATALEALLRHGFDAFPELYAPLTTDRNRRWVEALVPMLGERRDYLVVVGALHLVGHDGVLELLRARGYPVVAY